MKIKFAVYCTILLTSSLAQTFDLAQSYPVAGLNTSRLSSALDLDSQGRPVIGRMIENNLNYTDPYGDVVIEKLDESGGLLWSDTLAGGVHLDGLVVDRNDDIYVYGRFRDSLNVTGSDFPFSNDSETQSWIIKFDEGGQLVWMGNYSLAIPEIDHISSVCEGRDGLWVAAHVGFGESAIYKLDPGGAHEAHITQESVGAAMSMSEDPFGGLWVTGATSMGPQSFNGYEASAPFSYNQYIVRYDPSGTAQWVNFIEDVTAEHQVILTDHEGFAYFGTGLRDDFMFGDIQSQGPDWVFDFAITRLDSNGTFLWLQEIPADDQLGDGGEGLGTFLALGPDNSVTFTGFTRQNIDWGNGVITEANAYQDILLLNYSEDGEIQWAKTAGAEFWDSGDAVQVDPFGDVWLVGRHGETARFDSISLNGNHLNTFLARLTLETTKVDPFEVQTPPQIILYENYPNPFNPTTQISFDLPVASLVHLQVFEITGREVMTLTFGMMSAGHHIVNFSGEGLSTGVYIYQLTTSIGVQSKKMLLLN